MANAATERERIEWVERRKRAGLCYCLACWQREKGSGTDGSTERFEGAYRSRTGGSLRNRPGADCPVLQALRGGRPSYEISEGPLENPCWIWQGSLNSKGYPLRRSKATGHLLVHRAVYEHTHGSLPAAAQVHHRCEVKACVNPEHLDARDHLSHERLHAGEDCAANLVLRALAGGPKRFRDLALTFSASGLDPDSAGVAALRMARRGEIVRLSRGLYALPEEAAA